MAAARGKVRSIVQKIMFFEDVQRNFLFWRFNVKKFWRGFSIIKEQY